MVNTSQTNETFAADKKPANGEAPEITELRADARHMANLLERIRVDLCVIADEAQDEGGRVYFGLTVHAAELKEIAEKVDSLALDRIMRGKKQPDLYADLRSLRAEREIAKSELEAIAGNAPAKEPRNEPTVGYADDRRVDADQANDAIQQAFNEGHTRAWWEAGQMADALITKLSRGQS